ncbi:MAG: hypothetical protein ACKVVT_11305 [Dehalococcoidia bacterium]
MALVPPKRRVPRPRRSPHTEGITQPDAAEREPQWDARQVALAELAAQPGICPGSRPTNLRLPEWDDDEDDGFLSAIRRWRDAD